MLTSNYDMKRNINSNHFEDFTFRNSQKDLRKSMDYNLENIKFDYQKNVQLFDFENNSLNSKNSKDKNKG